MSWWRLRSFTGRRSSCACHLRPSQRRGAAVVEFSVCLPVLVIMVMGTIQASSFIFLKQSLHAAAYESARHAIQEKATNASAQQRCNNILSARNVKSGSIAFNVGDISRVARGDKIEVQVSAPTAGNTPLAAVIIPPQTITAKVVMVKE